MRFTKMHGAGNDFVVINAIEEDVPLSSASCLARTLCSRRTGIGADGLMLVAKAEGNADYRLLFYNSDGSLGEMCGNGARCIARYGYEHGLAGESQRIETTAGLVTGRRLKSGLVVYMVQHLQKITSQNRADTHGGGKSAFLPLLRARLDAVSIIPRLP